MKNKKVVKNQASENPAIELIAEVDTIVRTVFTKPMIGLLSTAKTSKKMNKDTDKLSDEITELLDDKKAIVIYKALSICMVRVMSEMDGLETILQLKTMLDNDDVMVQ
jgi:hypothetical protein